TYCFWSVGPGTIMHIYNNTCVGLGEGIRLDAGGEAKAINNLIQNSSDDAYPGSYVAGSNYNISDDSSSTGGAQDRINATVTFVDASEYDYRISILDSEAKGNGTDLSADPILAFTTDIARNTRTSPWTIGASNTYSSTYPNLTD